MSKDTDMTMQERLRRWTAGRVKEAYTMRQRDEADAADHIDQLESNLRDMDVVTHNLRLETDQLEADKAELVAWAVLATNEFNAVRARDGAPQHIDWYRGQPLQTDSCTHEWWDKMTEDGFALIAKHKAKP